MLLDDDVVTNGQAKPSSFTGRFGGEERIEHLFLHLGRNAGAVVANANFDTVAEVLGRGGKGGLIAAPIGFGFTLRRRIEAVGDQVENTRVISCGNRSTSPAAGSKDFSMVILKPCFSARAP